MRRLRALWVRILRVFRKSRADEDLSEELRTHVALHIEDSLRTGMSYERARRDALLRLGGVDLAQEQYRDRRGLPWIDHVMQDVRYGLRALQNNPGFTIVAVLTLALGMGANTAIFSVINGVLLRPLAYQDANRLVVIHEVVPPQFGATIIPVNAVHFEAWRRTTRAFDQMALIGGMTVNLTGSGDPQRVPAARVSSSLFPMLGVSVQLGRLFTDQEDQPGHDHVVLLNDELWRGRFNADPHIIGRAILLDDDRYEVIGVLSAGFRFPKLSDLYAMTITADRPQLWKPFALRDNERVAFSAFNYACIARLREGVSGLQAESELNVVQADLVRPAPELIQLRTAVVPLQDQITGRSRTGLYVLLAAVGFVLLIACVNIANLLLARTMARRREIAIRAAVGASTRRLVQQLIVESLLVSGIGGVLGVAMAYGTIPLIVASAPADLPRVDEVQLDARVLLAAVLATLFVGLLIGLLPAWRFARADPHDALASNATTTTGARHGGRIRAWLVGLEVGLSAACLMACGLLLHSFVNVLHVDRGFNADRVVTVDVNLPNSRYPDLEKKASFIRAVVERLESSPGVTSAGVSNKLPLSGEGGNNRLLVDGTSNLSPRNPPADVRQVNAHYFRTMGIPLREGRIFDDTDHNRTVAVVSTLTAERAWPGQSPIGQHFRIGAPDSVPLEVIGVVGDVRGVSLVKSPSPTVYVPYWQRFFNEASVAARTSGDPAIASSAIRTALQHIDPELPIPALQTMDQIVTGSVAARRFQVELVGLFAASAVVLALLGIYGVVSYTVTQRTREVGIRMALGADAHHIVRLVVGHGLFPVVVGVGIGTLASIVLGHVMQSLLFGVTPRDPVTMIMVVTLLAMVATVASYLPARRATRVDPVLALRCE